MIQLSFQNRPMFALLWVIVSCWILLLVWQAKWISDDGYIYLSYVANYFHRGELVFNPGETVDAATGFLWLLVLVLSEAISPFATVEQTTIALSLGLILSVQVVLVLSRPGFASLVASALLFAPYFMRSFATSGLETPMIVFALVALHYVPFAATRALIIGALPFIRPELALVGLIYLPLVLRAGWRWVFLAIAVGLGLAGLRYAIFGDVLPNTAFAKLGLPTYSNGIDYATEFVLSYPHLGVLLVAGILVGHGLWQQRPPLQVGRIAAPLCAAVILVLYTVKSGGDFMHGRFFLPAYTLLIISLAEASQSLFSTPFKLKSRQSLVGCLLVLSVPLALSGSSFAARGAQNWWNGVMDEAAGYAERNSNLHGWGLPNKHPWAQEGRDLAALSDRIDAPVGVAKGGIGQIRFFSTPGEVYIYDLLSLTQISGTLFDQMGRPDRPGHGSAVPFALVYEADRVTLFDPPDDELARLLTFSFGQSEFSLGALREIPLYVSVGLLEQDTENRVQERVEALLAQDPMDTRVLLYLNARYPVSGSSRERIEALYNAMAERSHTYPAWYESIRLDVEAANRITRGDENSLVARYEILHRSGVRPIERPFALRKAVSKTKRECFINASAWRIYGGAALVEDRFVASEPDVRLSLDKAAIIKRCGAEAEGVRLLVQPVFGKGSSPSTYVTHPGGERRFFPRDRYSELEGVLIPIDEIDDEIVVTPRIEPAQSIGFELFTYIE